MVEASDEAAARARAIQLAEQDGYTRIALVRVDRDLGAMWRLVLDVYPEKII